MDNEKQIPYLLRELRGRYAIPRKNAAAALAKIGTPAVAGLIESLSDRNPEVQSVAADTLSRIGTPEASAAVERWRGQIPG